MKTLLAIASVAMLAGCADPATQDWSHTGADHG